MSRLALGVAACALLVGWPHQSWADFIDTFTDTTFLGPPGISIGLNPSDGSQSTATVTSVDPSTVLGGNRSYGSADAASAASGISSVVLDTFVVVDGGAFQYSSSLATTGNTAVAAQLGLQYGVPGPNVSAEALDGPSASASVRFDGSGNFLANFNGQQGIAVDFQSLDAGAVGTVLTLALSDTALHAAELSLTVTASGAQTLLFPFASLVPTGGSGVFTTGVDAPLDLSSIGAIALVFEPELGGSFAVDAIRTVAAAVPQPASLALLGLGALGVAAYSSRRSGG